MGVFQDTSMIVRWSVGLEFNYRYGCLFIVDSVSTGISSIGAHALVFRVSYKL